MQAAGTASPKIPPTNTGNTSSPEPAPAALALAVVPTIKPPAAENIEQVVSATPAAGTSQGVWQSFYRKHPQTKSAGWEGLERVCEALVKIGYAPDWAVDAPLLAPCKAHREVSQGLLQAARLLCRLELKRLLPMADKSNSIHEVLTLLDPLPLSSAVPRSHK